MAGHKCSKIQEGDGPVSNMAGGGTGRRTHWPAHERAHVPALGLGGGVGLHSGSSRWHYHSGCEDIPDLQLFLNHEALKGTLFFSPLLPLTINCHFF